MECPKCGANVNDGDNFCEECGASLKKPAQNTKLFSENFPKTYSVVQDSNLAAATNVGRRHPTNEDAGTVAKCENGDVILIVSDGVSSSVGATSASQKAIEVMKEALYKNDKEPRDLIAAAICSADECIKSLPYETREDGIYGPEATVVAAIVKDNAVTIGWVGDSRAYVLNENKQQLVTLDDSWIELVVAEGSMTREEALADRRAHCVTQVLGMHDQEAQVHLIECSLEKGDMLLLCSDGLWNYMQSENAILNAIKAFGINSEAGSICEHLVGLANAAGGHDNITVAIYKYINYSDAE